MARRDHGICVVCNVRKARRVQRTCDPCHSLIEAEGTHGKYGVVKGSPTRQRWREQSAQYNKLIRKGLKQAEIAKLFGMSVDSLRSAVWRWKTKGGIKVVPGWANERLTRLTAPASTALAQAKHNDHGGGKWGITGCNCDLCLKARRHSRMLANRRYRERRNEKRAEARKKNVT